MGREKGRVWEERERREGVSEKAPSLRRRLQAMVADQADRGMGAHTGIRLVEPGAYRA